MRAQEHGLAGGRRVETDEDVAGGGGDRRAGVVLVGLEAAVAQVPDDAVGDRALLPGWARLGCELEEEIEDLRRHGG